MDGDLQDPPELIESFVDRWREGYDVVYAVRRTRKGESPFKLFTASLFYRTIKRLTKVSIPVDTGDFRLMSRRVVEALRRSPERHRFLRGMVSWVGFNQAGVDVRSRRTPFRNDEVSAAEDGALRDRRHHVVFGHPAAIRVVLRVHRQRDRVRLRARRRRDTNCSASIRRDTRPVGPRRFVAVLFLGGVQLMSLGILGEYIGRVYDEVKGRPLYLVADIERS